MSLILRNLGNKIITRGLGGQVIVQPGVSDTEEIDITLEAVVVNEEDFYPLTGTYAGVEGWKWSKTFPQNLNNIRERIESSLGGYKYNFEEGTIESDWDGGVLAGINLVNIKDYQDKTKRVGWQPEVSTGTYSIYHFNKRLFSKGSISRKVTSLTESFGSNVSLISTQVGLYKRDNKFNNFPYLDYEYSEDLIENSYFIEDNTIFLNNIIENKVGTTSEVKTEIELHNEFLGTFNNQRNIIYTEFFPVKDFRLVTFDGDQLVTFTQVNSFINSTDTDNHFILDEDLGRIVLPKLASEKKLYIKEDLGNEIVFFEEISQLPEESKLKNAADILHYKSKSKFSIFLDPSRQPVYSTGDSLVEVQLGKLNSSFQEIYCNYIAVPRIEVEVEETTFSSKLNLKPYEKINSHGILEISSQEKHINRINLTCDKPNIVGDVFGKLFIQNDSTKVTAEVLNSNNKPIAEVEVTFVAEEGYFEGDTEQSVKVTKLNGLANTFYSYEDTDANLRQIYNPLIIGQSSYIELDFIAPGSVPSDFTIFQVQKTDPYYGSLGLEYQVNEFKINRLNKSFILRLDSEVLLPEEYETVSVHRYDEDTVFDTKSRIDQTLCLDTFFNFGLCIIKFTSGASIKAIIRSINKNEVVVELTDKVLNSAALYSEVQSIRIFKRNELLFNSSRALSTGKTLDTILYSFSEESSEYKIVRPDRIIGRRIYFDNKHLPEGSLTDESTILAGYKVFGPKVVEINAFAIDPATGRNIQSNTLKIQIDFPEYLRSESGFRFKTDDSEESSGLGGINFISINPQIESNMNIYIED